MKLYYIFYSLLISFASLTPVIIAINLITDVIPELNWLSIFTSVATAIITGLMKLFKFQENWVTFRNNKHQLETEMWLFKSKTGEYSKKDANGVLDEDFIKKIFLRRTSEIISRDYEKFTDMQLSLKKDLK